MRTTRTLPEAIPVFPLSGVILLPRGNLPLNVFEPRYLAMVDDALKTERLIGIVQPSAADSQALRPRLFKIGGVGRITSFAETDDGRYLITLTGLSRFEILRELESSTPYRQVIADYARFSSDRAPGNEDEGVDRAALLAALKRYFSINQIESDWEAIERAPSETLVNSISMIAPIEPAEKQALLEAESIGERAKILIALIELSLADSAPTSSQRLN